MIKTKEEILDYHWVIFNKENGEDIILDSDFVHEVIYKAMEEYMKVGILNTT